MVLLLLPILHSLLLWRIVLTTVSVCSQLISYYRHHTTLVWHGLNSVITINNHFTYIGDRNQVLIVALGVVLSVLLLIVVISMLLLISKFLQISLL